MKDYTVQLFEMLVKKPAIGLSVDIQKKAREDCEMFVRDGGEEVSVERVMIEFGKHAWPYWQAYHVFFDRFGTEKEGEFILDILPEALAKKYTDFLAKGGSIHNFRAGQDYEDAFTSDEDLAIQNATVEAREAVTDFIIRLIEGGDKKTEYDALVVSYQDERDAVLAILGQLQNIATSHEKWSEEVLQDIYYIEKGFAELEERPTKDKAQGRLDWYLGQIDTEEVGIFS